MGQETPLEQSVNFLRAAMLLIDVGTEVLRDVLLKEIHVPKNQLQNYMQQNVSFLKGLEKSRVLTEPQYQLLVKVPLDLDEFDISLLSILLRNMCPNIAAPNVKWKFSSLQPGDSSIGAELLRIKNIRNTTMHTSTTRLPKSTFTHLWADLEARILSIAGQVGPGSTDKAKKSIESIKKANIDPSGAKATEILQKLQEQFNDASNLVLNDIKTKTELLQDQMTKISEQQGSSDAKLAEMNQQLQNMQRDNASRKDRTTQPNQRQNSKSSQSDKNVGDLPDKDIGIIARKIGFEWEQLAFQLDFEKGQVDALKRIYRDQPVALNIRMIECWRDVVVCCGESPRTLLVAAFASLENNAMAQSLVPPKDVEKIKDKVARKETQSKIKLILFDI